MREQGLETMSTMHYRIPALLIWVVFVASGCDTRSEYQRLVERELAAGTEHNEIFLGYELGMAKDAFYEHSWALNREGLVMQGPQNQTVQYELDDELPHAAKMFFYPDFYEGKVFQMRTRFLYDGWAPWNENLSADSLQMAVIDLFRTWYGDGFIVLGRATDATGESIQFAKVDGNRRIVVGRSSASEVMAVYTDLQVEKEIEARNGGYGDRE